MRETLACAPASTATAARTTVYPRRGRARQVGEPRREWCAVVHLSDTIFVWRGRRGWGRCAGSGRGIWRVEAEMCKDVPCTEWAVLSDLVL
jgi:hypothetical protein